MRVNEENFVTGNEEDIEPSYVDKVLELHNGDSNAHPEIMAQTEKFCQDTKNSVDGALVKFMRDVENEVAAAVEKCADDLNDVYNELDTHDRADDAHKSLFNSKANTSLSNINNDIFRQKAIQSGVGVVGGTITLDNAMSDTSGNAVQNKVIKAYVDELNKNHDHNNDYAVKNHNHNDIYATPKFVEEKISEYDNELGENLDGLGDELTKVMNEVLSDYVRMEQMAEALDTKPSYNDVTSAIRSHTGDIETALDRIIAIQNELIGGGVE